jgi:ABC-2 type transport system permease protein
MNTTIMELTFRQLLGKRRTILLVLLALVPALIALAFRASGHADDVIIQNGEAIDRQARFTAGPLMSSLVVGVLLPLCALVFATAALGSEIEDGTAVYLLSKPIPRWRVVISKLLVAWATTAVLVIPAAAIAGVIAIAGSGGTVTSFRFGTLDVQSGAGIVPGFLVALVAGSFLYCCIFTALSIFTSRALIVGLLYVFFWEALMTSLFGGLRIFSVRQYTLGIAHSLANTSNVAFSTKLDGPEAIILLAIASAIAISLAIRRLQRWEVGETS